jgi:hypothetical protein
VHFGEGLTYFSKSGWITHFQISHGIKCNPYLSKCSKDKLFLCCARLLSLYKAPKHRHIGVTPKTVHYPRKHDIRNIIR